MTLEQKEKHAHDLRNTGRTREAIELYQELFDKLDANQEYERAGGHLQMIGVCHKIDNNTELSLEWLKKAADYYRQHGIDKGVGNTLRDIAITYEYIDQLEEAVSYMEQALSILKSTPDRGGYGITLAKMGHLQARLGNFDLADKQLRESIEILHDTPDWFFEATAIGHLASLYIKTEHYQKAIDTITKSKELFDAHPDESQTRRYAQLFGSLAYCHAKLEHYEAAKHHFHAAMQIILDEAFSPKASAKVLRDIRASETLEVLAKL